MATVLHVAEPDAAISLRIQVIPNTCESNHNDSFSYCERQWRYYTTMIHVAPLSTKHSYIDDAYTQVSYVIRWRTQPAQRCQEVHRTNNQVGIAINKDADAAMKIEPGNYCRGIAIIVHLVFYNVLNNHGVLIMYLVKGTTNTRFICLGTDETVTA